MATLSRRHNPPAPHQPRPARESLRAQHAALAAELATACTELARLERTLLEAAQQQRRLCGPHQLRRGRFEICAELFPVRQLSGDFSSLFDLGPAGRNGCGEAGIVIGDVAGKGLAAALWVTHLAGLARLCAAESPDPAGALAAINRHLCALPEGVPLAALFFARLDMRRGTLRYSNAGLPAPLLLRGDGEEESLAAGGPMLGAVAEAVFENGEVQFQPGDTLVGFSDGIVECRNPRGEEFGSRRIADAARRAAGSPAGSLLFSILGGVQDFAAGRPRSDDFTLLVACCLP
jgi:serine phosphatase RsbU (regulator of sigma subunit)